VAASGSPLGVLGDIVLAPLASWELAPLAPQDFSETPEPVNFAVPSSPAPLLWGKGLGKGKRSIDDLCPVTVHGRTGRRRGVATVHG
jgi:hypothetical protein